jgi:hypothetical protein
MHSDPVVRRTPAGHVETCRSVVLLGVYLTDQPNNASHVVEEIGRTLAWRVEQRWIALGRATSDGRLQEVTVSRSERLVPKFTLLNQAIANLRLEDYEYVLICDDDILLPSGFLDSYMQIVSDYDLAVCQPARTHDSYIDHPFVERLDGLIARRTRFVEIGPFVSLRKDAAALLLPFDELSPMGWGYDLMWPSLLEGAGLRMGIVDAVAVAHSLRKPTAQYDYDTANGQMSQFLARRQHLSRDEAFFILESYAQPRRDPA